MTTSFQQRTAASFDDPYLRTTLTRVTARLDRLRREGLAARADFARVQAEAGAIRRRDLQDLPGLLEQLEAQLIRQGVEVAWAEDAAAAGRYVTALAQARRARRIVRSRSTVAEEVGLDAALAAAGLAVVDVQLGDYLLQLAGDQPSHLVHPALHRRKEDIGALMREKQDLPATLDIQAMVSMMRFRLRRQVQRAEMGIGGVTLAVAETGTLALAGDSGDHLLSWAIARIQVVLVGIDQVVRDLHGLAVLLNALALGSDGQAMPASVSLLHGPALAADSDGPAEVHVVIVDNGRSDLLRWGYGDALACIRCGACLDVCPIYREVGGHAYGPVTQGPIGSLELPLAPRPPRHFDASADAASRRLPWRTAQVAPGFVEPGAALAQQLAATPFADLPAASTLCGACSEACPVTIDLPGLLVRLRGDLADAGRATRPERQLRRLFAWATADPERYRRAQRWIQRGHGLAAAAPPWRAWLRARDLPPPAQQTFRERWQARQRSQ